MILRPSTVTVASRIMLPWYVVANAWLGLAYLLGDPQRTDRPGFDLARDTPGGIRTWGGVFLVVAAVICYGLLTGSRTLVGATLIYAAVWHFVWGVAVAASTFVTTASWHELTLGGVSMVYPHPSLDAGLTGPMWPWTLAAASLASAASLAWGEQHGS